MGVVLPPEPGPPPARTAGAWLSCTAPECPTGGVPQAPASGSVCACGGALAPAPVHLSDAHSFGATARQIGGYYDRGLGWCLPPDAAQSALVAAASLAPQSLADPRVARDVRALRWAARPELPPLAAHTPLARQRVADLCAAAGRPLHAYQAADAQWAADTVRNVGGAALAWGPGLGKTQTALTIADQVVGPGGALVLCPNAAKDVWRLALSELWRHGAHRVCSNSASGRASFAAWCADRPPESVAVVHYEALRLLPDAVRAGWDLLILDEAHRCKNPSTSWCRRLPKAPHRLLLSGTLVDGRISELHNLMRIMQPAKYSARWRTWNDRYVRHVDTGFGMAEAGPNIAALPQLRAALAECVRVREAADDDVSFSVPAPIRRRHEVKMLPVQQRVYRELAEKLMAELPDGGLLTADVGASVLARLRTVTAGVYDGGVYRSAKLDALADVLTPGTLVFTWHKELARQGAARYCGLVIDGSVPVAERARRLDAFRAGDSDVLFATVASLSEAVNLQEAAQVVWLEQSWRPADRKQGEARAVRQGQRKTVVIRDILCYGTVDTLTVAPRVDSKAALRSVVLP